VYVDFFHLPTVFVSAICAKACRIVYITNELENVLPCIGSHSSYLVYQSLLYLQLDVSIMNEVSIRKDTVRIV
jgi:uncharacterized protein (DUF169 family)